jgi:DNA-binding XRE family transcriptional regulator
MIRRRTAMSERTAEDKKDRQVDDVRALAQRLRESREYLGLSQEAVADHLGVPRASVSAMETGKRKVSSMELRDLGRLYRISVEQLLGKAPEEDPVVGALYRTARNLTQEDRAQVLRFAEFLRSAGTAPPAEAE